MTLAELGFEPFESEFEPYRDTGLVPARVAVQHRGGFDLLAGEGELVGVPAGTLDELPAVGDWVAARPLAGEDKAVIEAVLPRRTEFTRTDPWSGAEEVVAANVDVVFLVSALGRDLNLRRIERYLAAAYDSGADPVILVNKADLHAEEVSRAVSEVKRIAFDVPVHAISAKAGLGVDEVERYLAPGRTVALLGSSGVGKSTLANRLLGGDVLATAEVRADERGRHTTARRELLRLPGGGLLLDTPGLRELQLAGADLDETFPEITALAARCRFRDCMHEHEPGCAVLAAVESGELPAERLESYLKLQRELRAQELRRSRLLREEERRRWKRWNRALRARR